jgi:hypothetical protein
MEVTMTKLSIRIPKADTTINVDMDTVPDRSFRKLLEIGLAVHLNRRMSKIQTHNLEGIELSKARAAALALAESNLNEIYEDKINKPPKPTIKVDLPPKPNQPTAPHHEIPKNSACQTGKNVV